jgi:hypothetical protein
LQEVKYFTLKYLCCHLAKVAANSNVNQMRPKNLTIIFGPSLFGTLEVNKPESPNQPGLQIAIIELLIANCQFLFRRNNSELQVK